MDNLIFALNATVPIFLTMMIGLFLNKVGIMDEKFSGKLNTFVFKAALPVYLFQDLSQQNFYEVWDLKFVIFCFVVTLICISAMWLIAVKFVDKSVQGEFVQASYRSSAAILGIAFIQNIYGNSGMAPLMIIASVPLYNIMAVVVLSFLKTDRGQMDAALVKKTLKGIATNPIIIGIVVGLVWSLLRIPQPAIMQKTLKNLGVVSTPLGLMAMGASFDIGKALQSAKLACTAAAIKLFAFCALFLPVAAMLGFRESKLIAILVMLGSSTTVTSFVMAKNMGHKGVLTSAVVMLTTCGSAFSLTLWLFVLKSLGLI